MCNAHVVVTVSAAANAFAATLDRFSCRDGCGSRSAASLSLRSGCFVRINFVPRKRDHESSPKCHCKILRTRNSRRLMIADVFGDENEPVSNHIPRTRSYVQLQQQTHEAIERNGYEISRRASPGITTKDSRLS